jgi:hypothetical protein
MYEKCLQWKWSSHVMTPLGRFHHGTTKRRCNLRSSSFQAPNGATSVWSQKAASDRDQTTSALPPTKDVARQTGQVRKVPRADAES